VKISFCVAAACLALALSLGAQTAAAATVRIEVGGSVPELKNESNEAFIPGYFGPGQITINAAFNVTGTTWSTLQVSDIDATLTWENGAKVATATTGLNFLPAGGDATQGFLSAVFYVDTAPLSSEGNFTEFGLTLAVPEDPFQAVYPDVFFSGADFFALSVRFFTLPQTSNSNQAILERDGARGSVTVTSVAPIPLPAAGTLLVVGLAALAALARRRIV
jgi:hypothetical protein